MLKNSLAVLSLIFIFEVCIPQPKVLPGAYRNCVDFRNNSPLISDKKLIFKQKLDGQIKLLYKVKHHRGVIKRRTLKYSIWGIVHDGDFYLNARRIGMADGYIRMSLSGNLLYFRGKPLKHPAQDLSMANSAINYGLIGAAVESAYVKKNNKHLVHYILNLESGMVNLLTESYVKRVLQEYPMLLLEFEKDFSTDSITRLRHYIEEINKQEI